jgi:hypothetical protein
MAGSFGRWDDTLNVRLHIRAYDRSNDFLRRAIPLEEKRLEAPRLYLYKRLNNYTNI